jgi:hypothetical protein
VREGENEGFEIGDAGRVRERERERENIRKKKKKLTYEQ